MSIKVTIGIPTCNQARYVEQAVLSALAQTYPFIEVIVADDCSTDDTGAVLKKFAADPRFRYVKNSENLGRVANYKKLLYQLATGDWYINLDGDDHLLDNRFIAGAIQLIGADAGLVAVAADCERYDEKNKTSIIYSSHYSDGQVVDGTAYLQDIADGMAQVNHLTTMYKRQLAVDIDFYRAQILSSDFESIYRLFLHGRVGYLKTIAGRWRKHGENTVLLKSRKEAIRNMRLPQSVYAYAQTQGIDLLQWRTKVLKKMIAAFLLESKKQNYGQLVISLFYCLFTFPLATCKTIFNARAVFRHI